MHSNQLAKNRFLIVDNTAFSRDTLRRHLLSFGVERVDVAVSFGTAIKVCQDVEYDVVLSDYDLGDGKNGRQLLQELRSQKFLKNVSAFIMLTSEATREVVLSTMEFEPDDYIVKPYMQSLLLRRIKKLLHYKYIFHEVFEAIDNKNNKLAILWCQKYLDEKEDFVSNARRLLAELLYAENNNQGALKVYDDELVVNDSDWARMGVARIYIEEDRLKEAEALFLQLIDSNYLYIEAYENLSNIYSYQSQPQKAEEAMAKAVLVSPLSIKYQGQYAKLCEKNNHYEKAIDSWKQVLKAGRNTNIDEVETYLNLLRSQTDCCDFRNDYKEGGIVRDALKTLEKFHDKHSVYGDSELQSILLETRIHFGKGDNTKAESLMEEANKLYDTTPSTYSPLTKLELAKCFSKSGEPSRAEKVLKELVASCQDEDILSRADKILDEPVSKNGKRRIIELNRTGIKHFKVKEFELAAKGFRQAQLFFPKNIELNLNLIQALIKLIKSSKGSIDIEGWLTEVEQCLGLISHITTAHKKYPNYQRLSKEYETIQKKISS